jgi:hypothetical protein
VLLRTELRLQQLWFVLRMQSWLLPLGRPLWHVPPWLRLRLLRHLLQQLWLQQLRLRIGLFELRLQRWR